MLPNIIIALVVMAVCFGSKAMNQVMDKDRIDIPYETQDQLFHDKTESKYGYRGSQREGWPAPEKEQRCRAGGLKQKIKMRLIPH